MLNVVEVLVNYRVSVNMDINIVLHEVYLHFLPHHQLTKVPATLETFVFYQHSIFYLFVFTLWTIYPQTDTALATRIQKPYYIELNALT